MFAATNKVIHSLDGLPPCDDKRLLLRDVEVVDFTYEATTKSLFFLELYLKCLVEFRIYLRCLS